MSSLDAASAPGRRAPANEATTAKPGLGHGHGHSNGHGPTGGKQAGGKQAGGQHVGDSAITDPAADLRAFSRETIAKGSKSFALASLLFGEEMQADAQMLYAWCRHCDDVIDGQTLGGDAPDADLSAAERRTRVDHLRAQTVRALEGHHTGEHAFDAFAAVAARAKLPARYPLHLIDGFALDIEPRLYPTTESLMDYCYGVAGVVGVMMAIIMGVDPDDDETLARACDMGLAFQLTNICRDVMDDARGGRIYLPTAYLQEQGIAATPGAILDPANREAVWLAADRVLDDADRYYISASEGVRRLPPRAGAAVAAARNVYRAIGHRLRFRGPGVWDNRIVVPTWRKRWLALSGAATGAAASFTQRPRPMRAREGLWNRPI